MSPDDPDEFEESSEEVAARLRRVAADLARTPVDVAEMIRVKVTELESLAARLERYAKQKELANGGR